MRGHGGLAALIAGPQMNIYTDPVLLDVGAAVDALLAFEVGKASVVSHA